MMPLRKKKGGGKNPHENLERSLERMGDALVRETAYEQERLQAEKQRLEEAESALRASFEAQINALKKEHADQLKYEQEEREKEVQRVRDECERAFKKAKLGHEQMQKMAGMTQEQKMANLKAQMEEQAAVQATKEKEARVELLRRQVARRVMNSGLANGFSAWHDLWSAKTWAVNRLREVGNRLRAPEKAIAFQRIAEAAEAARHAKQLRSLAEEQAGLQGQALSLAEQLAAVTAACEERLVQMEEEKKLALERLRIELTGNAEEVMKLRAEQEKEARVELLRRQVGRRMLHQGLANGWSAWHELWSAKTYAMGRLREAAHRLHRPDLAGAWGVWVRMWYAKHKGKLEKDTASKGSLVAEQAAAITRLEKEVGQLRQELQYMSDEKSELKAKVAALGGDVEGIEALRQQQLAKEKEERVELLRRQIVRRALNSQLSIGWSSWYDFWRAKTYSMNMLRKIANRLRTPELANAFNWMVHEWVEAKREAEEKKFQEQLEKMAGANSGMSFELKQVTDEFNQRLKDMELEKELALERLRTELIGNADEVERLRAEQEKEARVELMRRQVTRRMLNADLANGWSAWYDLWTAKTWAMNRLREVGNRFKSPELALAFEFWAREAEHGRWQKKLALQKQQAKELQGAKRELDEALDVIKREYEKKLANAEEQRLALLERVAVLGGGQAEAEALLEARAAQEKEERIELLRRQSVRRVMNAGLASGFSAWIDFWEAKTYSMRRLREVGNRLVKSDVAFAFYEWRAAQEEERMAAKVSVAHGRLEEMQAERDQLLREVKKVRKEMEAKLATATEDKERVLQRQLIELTGSAEDIMKLRNDQEKEARIELLRRQSLRRVANRDIAAGFKAWIELVEAKAYSMERLRTVGNRLRAPELAQAFSFWAQDSRDMKHQKEIEELEKLSKSVEAQLRHARHEAGQLQLLRVAHEDEIRALKDRLTELTGKVGDQATALGGAAGLAGMYELLQKDYAETIEKLSDAERKLDEQELDALQKRDEATALLEKLLAEQRAGFDKELEDLTKRSGEWATEEHNLKANLQQTKKELEQLAKTTKREIDDLNRHLEKSKEATLKAEQKVEAEKAKAKELLEKARAKPPPKEKAPPKGASLLKVDLDEGPDALPYSVQLANALKKNATRVIDLFRSWDTDGDGEVTRKEFHTAMGLLGLEVPKESVDSLFSEWDKDGGGAINFGELKKILSARVQSPTEKKIAAAEVKIQEAAAAASIVGKLKADATTGLASKLKKK